MEIRDYAERVLFSKDLTHKLGCPPKLTDRTPGPPLLRVEAPHRAYGMELAAHRNKRARFPTRSALENPKQRGRVLHFFANHELLALELMALTLLRFPDAPPRFRKRLVATMRDEQKHMQLYLERMKDFGVSMGEIPLNSFFWDLLSKVETVAEFVAGMSLTFEQANLDFSIYFRDIFEQLGDTETAGIMQTVLEDEVAHVRHGVHYLDQWRGTRLSQWDAYTEALVFPLTPARAKGMTFNRKVREKAGLSSRFIDELSVFAHSKGRVPDVHIFTPDVEAVLARGQSNYTPTKVVSALRRDLESLPMFLASTDDVVLVERRPETRHLNKLSTLGYTIPEFVVNHVDDETLKKNIGFAQRELGHCLPWGWDHRLVAQLKPIAANFRCPQHGFAEVVEQRRPLMAKTWLAYRLNDCLSALPDAYKRHCITTNPLTVCETHTQLLTAFQDIASSGYPTAAVKAPYGAAGGQLQRIDTKAPARKQMAWCERIIEQQGAVVVEPFYERLMDLSFLFKLTADGELKPVGMTRFMTDAQGRYRGTFIGHMKHCIPKPLADFVYRAGQRSDWIKDTAKCIAAHLKNDLKNAHFQGRAGIDFMVVKDRDGVIKLRIPLELNARPTMGHVALALGRPFGTRACGLWLLLTKHDLQRSEHTTFSGLIDDLSNHLPTQFAPDQRGPTQGVVTTNDPMHATHALGVCVVAKSMSIVLDVVSTHTGIALPTNL